VALACSLGIAVLVAAQAPADPQRLEEAVGSLGERCYPGNAFNTALIAPPEPRPGHRSNPLRAALAVLSSLRQPSIPSAFKVGQVAPPRRARPAQHRELTGTTDFAELSTLADIERVIYRKAQSEIILMGPPATGGDGLRFDDWVAILRSVSKFGSPAVSIDPGDTPNVMKVSYFGGIENSHVGATFFEADRTLKLLSTGFDNLDCSRWSNQPPDLLTELDLIDGEMRTAAPADHGWHRFWFEPTNETVKEDPVTPTSIRFEEQRLAVLDESIPPGRPSWSAQQFSQAISKRFMSLRSTIPSFAELHRQAVLVSLAKWMVDRNIPVERSWVEGTPAPTETPKSTPSITVMRATLLDQGYLRYGIHGGVDFQKANRYAKESGVAKPFASALQARPSGSTGWNFVHAGQKYRAAAIKIRNPVPMARPSVRFERTNILLPQPRVDQLTIPTGYIRGLSRLTVQNNDGGSTVIVRLAGQLHGTFVVPPMTQTAIGLLPGTYQVSATASCGTSNKSLTVQEGELATETYRCEVQRILR
jgi:hypothetical protein